MEELRTEPFVLNVGPQHPSTHGVFRMRLTLDGEVIVDMEPIFGYLHRGLEKLAEERTYTQDITLTDRADYLAAMSNNLGLVLAVEKLCGIPIPERAQYIRVIMAELQRIASHCFGVGTILNDLGAWHTPLMYMMREREKILDLFEMACGARLTYNYMRVGGVSHDLPEPFLPALKRLLGDLPHYIDDYEGMIVDNEIVLTRARGVGVLPAEKAINASTSGPVLRASGVKWDLRKADPYCVYNRLQFDIPTGTMGDVYDRLWVRLQEMRQSVRIVEQAVRELPQGPYLTRGPFVLYPPKGEVYAHVEGPRGELGYYLVSDGSIAPYRFKVRAPSFINLTVLRDLVVGWKLADAVIVLGSIDIVMGEVDR